MRHDPLIAGLALGALAGVAPAGAPGVARYRVTFEATWTEATHPTDFPSNPHFSPLIGGTHNAGVVFWEPGGIATWGIERMAEAGRFVELQAEIEAAMVLGDAETVIQQAGTPSPGVRTKEFTTHESHPLVTVVTMVAPSPDWFVGVHSVTLLVGGQWVEEVSFELMPYDAGTDAGVTFTSPNEDITPHIPIVEIGAQFPFNGGGPLGTMTFELLEVTPGGCSRADLAEPYGSLDFNDVVAYLSAFGADDPAADIAPPMDQLDFTDVTTFLVVYSGGCP